MDQIYLKGKENELAMRQEYLYVHEATIMCEDQDLQAHEATLKNKSERNKDVKKRSLGHKRNGKHPCYT